MTERAKILVVDDNQDLANNIADILNARGFAAAAAQAGGGAIAGWRAQRFALALLDYMLPDMDGLALQERLSELIHGDYIIFTAHASLESAAEAVKRKKMVGYETKPLDMERLIAFMQQVIERRRAEAALRRSEAMARTLLNIPAAVAFMTDRDGIILDANDTMAEQFRKSAHDLIGRPVWDFFPADVDARRKDYFREALETKKQVRHEDEREGVWRDVILTPVLNDAGEAETVVIIAFDITERKKAEQERLEMERRILELQRLESLGVMAGGIAHDFNNILMVVIGNIELAMEEPGQSPAALENLEESRKAARRAASLVRQILAYSGKEHFVIRPTNLNAVIEDMAGLLQAPIHSQAWLETRLEEGIPVIQADTAQLKQIIMNLITNAYEAMDERAGGGVVLSTGVETCDAADLKATVADVWMGYEEPLKEGPYVYLDVTDEGGGMGAETSARIFEPFFTTRFQGRGLGLSAVLGIVRGHGGFIRLESCPGQGTHIRILFPAAGDASAPGRTPPPPREADPRDGRLVLLADDDAPVLRIMRQMLERAGYRVITAPDGADALTLYNRRADDIDFILLDLSMPGMSGAEVFHELKKLGCAVPVILASGYNERDIRRRFADQGFAGFIQKPFNKKSLIDLLERLDG